MARLPQRRFRSFGNRVHMLHFIEQ